MESYVSAVVFCRGHGSPAPRNSHRRARTGKVSRIDSGHYAVNVGDPEVALLVVLLFVPLLSLLSLLLGLGTEGAVVENYVSAVVFCRGHGSPAPRNSHRRARTGKVSRIDSGHYAVNVGDPEVGLLDVGCADALVLRRKSLEDDVLKLTVRRSLWGVARIEVFAASIELIQKFVGVLARTQSRGVHFGALCSERFPRTAIQLFAKGGPRALSVAWALVECLACRAADDGACCTFRLGTARCTSPRWPRSMPRAWNRRCLSPQMVPALPVRLGKRPCRRCQG